KPCSWILGRQQKGRNPKPGAPFLVSWNSYRVYCLVIFLGKLEIGLGVLADRADLECFGSFMSMTAIAASPADRLILGEEGVCFQLLKQRQVTLLVSLFNLPDGFEHESDLREALFLCLTCHARVHVGAFLEFAGRSGTQIVDG